MNRITTYPGDVLKEELIEMKRIDEFNREINITGIGRYKGIEEAL